MTDTIIDIQRVTKAYQNAIPAVHNVTLSIQKGEFVTIIGPSGCGKTTLLRVINAMTDFDSGRISVMNRN